jgi:hypothetical protein
MQLRNGYGLMVFTLQPSYNQLTIYLIVYLFDNMFYK